MKIFLLSMTNNLIPKLSLKMKEEIDKRGGKIAYISSVPQSGDKPYYLSTIVDYSVITSTVMVDYFDLGDTFSDDQIASLQDYKIIYLSGGNTFTFMNDARKRGLKDILETFLNNDGLLIGASAGSIMCTDSIEIALDSDENKVGMTDFSGFGFVNLTFYPHSGTSDREDLLLEKYQKNYRGEIVTCEDGSGLFIDGKERFFYGNVSIFTN